MTVYKITSLAKPPGKHPNYADVTTKDDPQNQLRGTDLFLGKPYPGRWKPIELYIRTPARPKPDFFKFVSTTLLFGEKTRDLIGEAVIDAAELLPVSIERQPGQYFICNVTNTMNVVDHEKSVWRNWGPKGEYRQLETPAFIPERFEDETLFKITEDAGSGIYCLERTGDPADGEFKALVETHHLTGLEFKPIWTNGPLNG